MTREPERTYDSFVVRLWRDPASGRLLRAEVEHVQTGNISAERGVPPEWILDCLRSCLKGRLETGDGGPERDAAPSASPDSASGTEPRPRGKKRGPSGLLSGDDAAGGQGVDSKHGRARGRVS